jgi:hypothetical protein
MKTTSILLALAMLSSAAQAHVTLDTTTGIAGSYQKLAFRVGHGCDGKATTGLAITLPEGAIAAKPMPKAGWKIDIVDREALHESAGTAACCRMRISMNSWCSLNCPKSRASSIFASSSNAARPAWRGTKSPTTPASN